MSDESYKLSAKEHEDILQKLLSNTLERSEYQEQPRIVILGGQPGSGKSKLTEIAHDSFFDNQSVAVINGDDYRAYHPKAREIYELHDKKFAEMTDPDVRTWTPRIFEEAIKEKRNIIFEATMRNKEPLMTTIETLKGEGYKIGIMVMAVNEQVSRVGIVRRYEDQKANGGIARWTPIETHDEAFKNMPDAVAAIERNSSIDSISVYNRAGEILYKNEKQANGIFERPSVGLGAEKAIREEHDRPLTILEKEKLQLTIEDIQEKMTQRGALDEFKELQKDVIRSTKERPEADEIMTQLKGDFDKLYRSFWQKKQENRLTNNDVHEVYIAAASVIQREVITNGMTREGAITKHEQEGILVTGYETTRNSQKDTSINVESKKVVPELPEKKPNTRELGKNPDRGTPNDKGRGSGGGMSI
jgi:predicted ABC-type ATPase